MRGRFASLAAVTAAAGILGVTFGLMAPLLSLRLTGMGASETVVGLNAAMPAVASLVTAAWLPRWIAALGPRRFLLACLTATAATQALFPLFPDVAAWFAIRLAYGVAATGLFVVSEVWINSLAEDAYRGRAVAAYSTVLGLGLVAGAAALPVIGIEGARPFLFGAAVTVAAALPVAFARGASPEIDRPRLSAVAAIVPAAPEALTAALVMGLLYLGVFSLLPVYAVEVGLDVAVASRAVAVCGLGLVVGPLVVGWLADRLDRRRLLAAQGVLIGLAAACLPFTMTFAPARWAALLVLGAATMGLYVVALTVLGERYRGGRLAAASAALNVAFGMGELVGPPSIGAVMGAWPPHGFAAGVVAVSALYLASMPALARAARPVTPREAGP